MSNLSDVLNHSLHHHHDDDNDDDNRVLIAKGVCMIVLFCASVFSGLLPIFLAKKLKWVSVDDAENLKSTNRLVVCLLSLGGGVLLSTTFLHLLPEIQENVESLQSTGELATFNFSLTPLLTCCGFFMMYLVEELVHLYIHRREAQNTKDAGLVRSLSIRRSRSAHENGDKSITTSTADLVDSDLFNKSKDVENCRCYPHEPINDKSMKLAPPPPQHHGHSHHGHSHMAPAAGGSDDVTSALRGLLIVLALSIHELFEGLAVGLEDSTSHVWYMLGAISAHKLVLAFCIGVELIATRTKTWLAMVYIFTFAIISSLGIGIGMLLVGGGGATAAGVYSVVLQGLASGTLLYVIFFEIWSGTRTGMLQYFSSILGFFVMFGLQLLTPHSHSHGNEQDHGHVH